MYKKPTKKGIKNAMEFGWERKQAERGYEVFNIFGSGLLVLERIDDCYDWDGNDNVSDEDCAREAERSGYCKIIPVEELPKDFHIYIGCERNYFGWIDTPENRKAIEDYCRKGGN